MSYTVGEPQYWRPPRQYPYRIGLGEPPQYWRPPRQYPYRIGLGQIPTGADVAARIQAELGEFLQARAQIAEMLRRARTADELSAVQMLEVRQGELEAELPQALNAAQALKRGEYNLVLGAQVASFAVRLSDHMTQVRRVRARMGVGPAAAAGVTLGGGLLLGAAVLGGLVLLTMFRPRR